MTNFLAKFGSRIWTEDSMSKDATIYFVKGGTPFHLQRFASEEEPKRIVKALKENWHPNFANVSHIFQVEGERDYFLAFEKLGVSLKDFAVGNKNLFFDRHIISQLYQQIITDLLRVFQHLIKLGVKAGLSLESIYISGDGPWHVTLTDFSGGNSDWKDLAQIIENINTTCGYNGYANREMKFFLDGLRNGYRNFFEKLHTQPLFWSLAMRRSFTCDVWDFIKYSPKRIDYGKKMFGETATSWRSIVCNDTKLSKIKNQIDKYEALRARDREEKSRDSKIDRKFFFTLEEIATRDCLAFIRKSFAHFENLKKFLNDPDLQSEKQVQLLFESAFPNYIWELREGASLFETTFQVKLIPEKEVLKNLYIP